MAAIVFGAILRYTHPMKMGRPFTTGKRTTEQILQSHIKEIPDKNAFPDGIFVKRDGTKNDYCLHSWAEVPQLLQRRILRSLKTDDGKLLFAFVLYRTDEGYKAAYGLTVRDEWRAEFSFDESGRFLETPGRTANLPMQMRRNRKESQ